MTESAKFDTKLCNHVKYMGYGCLLILMLQLARLYMFINLYRTTIIINYKACFPFDFRGKKKPHTHTHTQNTNKDKQYDLELQLTSDK